MERRHLACGSPASCRQSTRSLLRAVLHLISSVRQHSLDPIDIAIGDQYVNIQISLPLIRFLGQDVSRMRMAAFDLTGRGHAESLCRAFMCFQFCHYCSLPISPISNHELATLI
jgi:hypothetical protein